MTAKRTILTYTGLKVLENELEELKVVRRKEVAQKIKEARERAHLTQEDLAEIVDVSPTHMSVIERGVKTPKLDTFVRIIKALNLSADALLMDGADQLNDSIVTELSVRIGRMPQKDQERILNAIRALTE